MSCVASVMALMASIMMPPKKESAARRGTRRRFLPAALAPDRIGTGPQRLVADGVGERFGLHGEEALALLGRGGAWVAPGAGDRRALGEGIEAREARGRVDRRGRLLH